MLNSAKSNKARTSRFKSGDDASIVYNAGRLGFEFCLGTAGSYKKPNLLLTTVRPVEKSQSLIPLDENAKFWVSKLSSKIGLELGIESGTREIRGGN